MPKESLADHSSTTRSQLTAWQGNRELFLSIKFVKDITVVRYLLSKIVFTMETIDPSEILILYEAFESVVSKMALDPGFFQKHSFEIFYFRSIFQSLDEIARMKPETRYERFAVYRCRPGSKFASKSYYYIVRGQLLKLYEFKVQERFKRKPKPKAFIGMGYGDHGTAKDLSYDASPSWQEVAMSMDPNGVSDISRTDKENRLFSELQVHPAQLWKLR